MADVETKAAPLQQGVLVEVVGLSSMKEAWADFERDDYESDMDKVCGKRGTLLHQHPSGAFTVVFKGKESGLKKGVVYRFKFPPKALKSLDTVEVKKRRPRPAKKKKPASPQRASPTSSTPVPAMDVVVPEVVMEPPPESTGAQRSIDECLTPPRHDTDPAARSVSVEASRWLALAAEEEDNEQEELGLAPPPAVEAPAPASTPAPADDDDDDEEAAFLEELDEAEAAEEAAFLAELDEEGDGTESSAAPSPPPSSSPASPHSSLASPPGQQQQQRRRPEMAQEVVVPVIDNGPRVQVIYEPHAAVAVNAVRFGTTKNVNKVNHGSEAAVKGQKQGEGDENEKSGSPRTQVNRQNSMRVTDLCARFDP